MNQYTEPHGSKERIEEQLRIALEGHADSELWGEHGLIAATMRCVHGYEKLQSELTQACLREQSAIEDYKYQKAREGELNLQLSEELARTTDMSDRLTRLSERCDELRLVLTDMVDYRHGAFVRAKDLLNEP